MVYEVIVDISNSEVDKIFDYGAPFSVRPGMRVLVPFGRRHVEGFVIGTKEKSDYDVKDIILKLDEEPVVLPEMLDLMRWMSRRNLRLVDCLRLFIPSKLRGGRVKVLRRNFVLLADGVDVEARLPELARAPKQQEVLLALKEGGSFESELTKRFSPAAIKGLEQKGLIRIVSEERGRTPDAIRAESKQIVLTDDQRHAIETIVTGKESAYLLHGVTGSGKTEVYMNVIESVLNEGKTAIMLVPEISLTPQMLGVFRARFGDRVSLLHSGLSDGERYDEWLSLLSGQARVVLGARSAIFAPVDNLGVIIIDEEHDSSYVSEGNPRYFTSEVAEFRARYHGAKLVLGSATPSIDTYLKAKNGQYRLIALKERANRKQMPSIDTVDMRKEIRSGNLSIFSRELLRALDKTLAEGNQAMIFVNRRGYASFVRCRSCGYVAKCTDCDVSLTYHKEDNRLKCHYCGKQFEALTACPVCGFKGLKEGKVGTEKVVAELKRIFPSARVLRMDNDTTSTKNAYLDILSTFAEGKADILVGTQMIAKGHDFKNVTLVGILDADLALYFSDYRSNERTFQLITQVAGRAGREQKPGRVIMQTYNPNHFVFGFAAHYDYEGFFEKEANARETTKFPPYSKILRILVLSHEDEQAIAGARTLYERVKAYAAAHPEAIIRVQVMRAPIRRIQNYYRYQLVVWLKKDVTEGHLEAIYDEVRRLDVKNISVFTEINPQQMV